MKGKFYRNRYKNNKTIIKKSRENTLAFSLDFINEKLTKQLLFDIFTAFYLEIFFLGILKRHYESLLRGTEIPGFYLF